MQLTYTPRDIGIWKRFVEALQARGWTLEEGVVVAPAGSISFQTQEPWQGDIDWFLAMLIRREARLREYRFNPTCDDHDGVDSHEETLAALETLKCVLRLPPFRNPAARHAVLSSSAEPDFSTQSFSESHRQQIATALQHIHDWRQQTLDLVGLINSLERIGRALDAVLPAAIKTRFVAAWTELEVCYSLGFAHQRSITQQECEVASRDVAHLEALFQSLHRPT